MQRQVSTRGPVTVGRVNWGYASCRDRLSWSSTVLKMQEKEPETAHPAAGRYTVVLAGVIQTTRLGPPGLLGRLDVPFGLIHETAV